MSGTIAASRRPRVVYWNYMPAPYMVDRFNALARRGHIDFEAWFNARREPHWSGAWEINEHDWEFGYRYIPSHMIRGRTLGFPPALLSRRLPDVLISPHGEPSFVLGWCAARLRGIRTAFWVVRTFDSWTPRIGYKEALKRRMLPRADAILVPGPDAETFARSYGASSDRIMRIHHPINVDFIALGPTPPVERESIRRRYGLVGTTFIYVGRLWWGKGLGYLLDAFSSVQRSGRAVSLLIVGDGPEEGALRDRCRAEGLRVIITGFKQKHELPAYYRASDAFVFPTLGDPFGLVIGEAMACALPVVATTAAGEIRERVEHGINGLLVPPANSIALAAAMRELSDDPARMRAMGLVSAERVKGHTPDRWAAELEHAIGRILTVPSVREVSRL